MTVATIPTSEPPSEPRSKRWTLEEFYKLTEDGWFKGQRVLLLDGEIIQMPPMKHPHAWSVSKVYDSLRQIFGDRHWVRQDMPLNASDRSDPEPDVAVTEFPMKKYKDHPATAILVVEIAESSLPLDRKKVAVYAEAGVTEYWILNLKDRQLEVFRSPDAATRTYRETRIVAQNDSIAPLAAPNAAVKVSDLLP